MPAALDSSDQNPPPSEPGGLKSGALRVLALLPVAWARKEAPVARRAQVVHRNKLPE